MTKEELLETGTVVAHLGPKPSILKVTEENGLLFLDGSLREHGTSRSHKQEVDETLLKSLVKKNGKITISRSQLGY